MIKRFVASALLALLAAGAAFADPTPIKGLSRYALDNGLELFVLENHAVPLARVQITFRSGAIAQTAKTAGLFHLYEHMLFKGNAKYKTETDFTAAMADLGVANWNGGTSNEYVTYYFTIPSDKLDQGLEFWSQAVRAPLFDPAELETEKKVVADEISGDFNDPSVVFQSAISSRLFYKYPYRRDALGTIDNVKSATPAILRDIQSKYYVPNNAAIFIGGDVTPEAAFAATRKWYGDWKRGDDPWKSPLPPQAIPAVRLPTFVLYSDPSLPAGIGLIDMYYRGPDVMGDPKSTYAADVWGTLVANPDGKFKTDIMKSVPKLYDKDYINAGYYTQRDGGQITISTAFLVDPAAPAWRRAQAEFKETVRGMEIESMRVNPSGYFSKSEFEAVKTKLEDDRIASLETADGFVSELSFWWATASADYFFGYLDNMKKVTASDLSDFIFKYISKNLEIVAVRLSPADYKNESKAAIDHGFTVLDASNAFWWKK